MLGGCRTSGANLRTQPEVSSLEVFSVAPTSAQLLPPGYDHFLADQGLQSAQFDTASFQSTPIEGSTRLSCTASANSAGTSLSSESLTLPLSPPFISLFDVELKKGFTSANQSSNHEASRPKPLHRRRKPGSSSSKLTEPLACPQCPKIFPRRCELR